MKKERICVACYYFKSKQAWVRCWHWKGTREDQRELEEYQRQTAAALQLCLGPREASSRATALFWQREAGMRALTLAPISVPLTMPRALCSARDITLLLTVTPGRAEMTDPTPRQGNLLNWKSHKGFCVCVWYLWNSLVCKERNCAGPVCRWEEYIWGVEDPVSYSPSSFHKGYSPLLLHKHSHHCSSQATHLRKASHKKNEEERSLIVLCSFTTQRLSITSV